MTNRARSSWGKFVTLSLLGSLVLGASSCASCQSTLGVARQGLVMRDVAYPLRDMRFPSGLRVLAEQDPRSPVVALVLVVGAGSSSDPLGKEGLAHYVEHLAFRSRPFGKASMARMLDTAGAGKWNAFTGFDTTVYFEMGPKEALGSLLQLEGTRMVAPVARLAPETIAVELNVVRNELRQRSETGFTGELFGSMQGLLFPSSHPYSRPVGGTHASLSNIGVDDVTGFLEKHYRPENMTLLVIGDIDLDTIGTLVEQSLPKPLREGTGAKSPPSRLPPVAPDPPPPPPSSLVTKEAAVATPELWIGWSLPRAFDSDAYRAEFANTAIGDALRSAESEDEDITFVNTFVVDGKEASMLLCQVGLTTGGHPEKSYAHILNALSTVWTRSTSVSNVKREEIGFRHQQRRAIVDMVLEAEDLAGRGISRATSTHFTGDPTVYSRSIVSVNRLEPSQIAEFAEKYVNRGRARAVLFRPLKGGSELPESTALKAHTVEDEDNRPVRADADRLKTILPSLGASSFAAFTLENGLDVVVVERPGLPLVTADVVIYGGYGGANDIGAAYAGMWLQRPESVWHGKPIEIGASLRWNFDEDSIVYSMTGSSGNTNLLVAMLGERVQSLSVDSGRWAYFERNRLPYLEAAENQPEQIADRAFRKGLFGQTAYGRSFVAANFANMSASKAQTWIDATHVPNNAALVIVGEIERAKVEPAIREFFGSWKRGSHAVNTVTSLQPGNNPASAPTLVTTHRPDATQAQIRFGCLLPVTRNRATDARHDVGAALLSERIGNVLRQQAGVTYGIYANAWVLRGGTAYLDIRGAVEAPKLTMSLVSIRNSLDGLTQTPVNGQELARLKLKLARQKSTQFLSNSSIAGGVVGVQNLGFSLASLDEDATNFADVTPEQVQEDFKACMAGRPTLSILGDEPVVNAAFKEAWLTAPTPAAPAPESAPAKP